MWLADSGLLLKKQLKPFSLTWQVFVETTVLTWFCIGTAVFNFLIFFIPFTCAALCDSLLFRCFYSAPALPLFHLILVPGTSVTSVEAATITGHWPHKICAFWSPRHPLLLLPVSTQDFSAAAETQAGERRWCSSQGQQHLEYSDHINRIQMCW